jgi:hypothetical protein
MPTLEQINQFCRINAGYSTAKRTHPENGSLYLDGFLHLYNLPFAILQAERTRLIRKGYTSKRIKIKYKDF